MHFNLSQYHFTFMILIVHSSQAHGKWYILCHWYYRCLVTCYAEQLVVDVLQEYAKERIDSYFELKAELVGVEVGVKRKVTELDWAGSRDAAQ